MKKLLRIVLGLIALYILLVLAFYNFQEQILFSGDSLPTDYTHNYDVPFTEVNIPVEEGVSLNALHFKAENAKGVILYLHGNSGNVATWAQIVSPWTYYGYDILVVDYRGYGKSGGAITQEDDLYADAIKCYDYLKQSYTDSQIVIYGRSIGTGIAAGLAAQRSPNMVVLEAPFYELYDAVISKVKIFPPAFVMRYNMPSYQHLANVSCPVHVIHGTKDSVVPYISGQQLYAVVKSKGGNFYPIQNGRHNDLDTFDDYRKALAQLLN